MDRSNQTSWMYLFIAWLLASIATAGSLFFSEVMEFVPCAMCWYQRICMYPLVVILLAGLFPLNKDTFKFAIPLVVIGWLWALYHNLLQWGIIPESAAPCVSGVPCSAVYLGWLGFITIPLLSLFAFSLIGVLLILFHRKTL